VFITFQQLQQAVKDQLQKGQVEQLSQYWGTIINAALNQSYGYLLDAMTKRGFLKVIIDQWDRGAEFQQDLGVWAALQRISTQTSVKIEQEAINLFDRRGELNGGQQMIGGKLVKVDGVGLLVNGVWQDPGQSTVTTTPSQTVGQAVTGAISGEKVPGWWWSDFHHHSMEQD
jgi:hypothetical protein